MPGWTLPVIDISEIEKWKYETPFSLMYPSQNLITNLRNILLFENFNSLNAELNPICHLLALLGAHHILHVSRIRVKSGSNAH